MMAHPRRKVAFPEIQTARSNGQGSRFDAHHVRSPETDRCPLVVTRANVRLNAESLGLDRPLAITVCCCRSRHSDRPEHREACCTDEDLLGINTHVPSVANETASMVVMVPPCCGPPPLLPRVSKVPGLRPP